MLPAFKSGDLVLVNRLSYLFGKPKVGDVIILKKKKFIIKRIAKISKDKVFVMGDNRKESTDSRSFGWIARKEIVGKIMAKI
ncbi:MAG: Peptidase [Candidatus Levybacteria bacterium]|nr:Peptidase [Candidatus Levybacteria bacterium]